MRSNVHFYSIATVSLMLSVLLQAVPSMVLADVISPTVLPIVVSPAPTVSAMPSKAESTQPTSRAQGVHFQSEASATYIDQSTFGTGQVGDESSGFINGSPLSPNTPYDLFSSAPQVPGKAGIGQITTTATWDLPKFEIALTGGLGYVQGNVTNASYWAENLMPTLNPHLGSQALPYTIAFPNHPGQDGGTATRLSLLSGSVATADSALRLRGGWFDLAQTDRFVFVQPALTNANPAIAYAPVETLGNAITGLSSWQSDAAALPLQGVDLVAHRGNATAELTNASLPSLPGEAAKLTMGSLVVDHGEGTRYSAQFLHAVTSGTPFITTVPFGSAPQFTQTPQGVLPTSTLSGQRQTILGLRAAYHLFPKYAVDGVTEIGRSWYDADPVAYPGTQRPGGYYHTGLSVTRRRATTSLDLYRMEPRYATMILPYGIAENQWSAAFAWPGQWLKSNYQLIDNSVLGVNRQGYRLRYSVDKGPLEMRFEYTDLRQLEPETSVTATQSGFVDGYYLPQLPGVATLGRQQRYGFWTAWHPRIGDFSLDIVDDVLSRSFAATHPEDAVAYHVPQAVLSFAKHLSPDSMISLGVGSYAMKGTFSEPIDFRERLYFLGSEINESKSASLLMTLRRTTFTGISTVPSGTSPAFTGTALIIEQRKKF